MKLGITETTNSFTLELNLNAVNYQLKDNNYSLIKENNHHWIGETHHNWIKEIHHNWIRETHHNWMRETHDNRMRELSKVDISFPLSEIKS